MEMVNSNMIACLLGQTISRISRVELVANDQVGDGMGDTLVFHLQNGEVFELLSRQEGQLFTKITVNSPIHANFEIESHESLIEVSVTDLQAELPLYVHGICQHIEMSREPYLIAMSFWSHGYESQICLLLETDEIELVSLGQLSKLVMGRPYEFPVVEQRWYQATAGE